MDPIATLDDADVSLASGDVASAQLRWKHTGPGVGPAASSRLAATPWHRFSQVAFCARGGRRPSTTPVSASAPWPIAFANGSSEPALRACHQKRPEQQGRREQQ